MATTINQNFIAPRTTLQKSTIGAGIFLVLVGLVGVVSHGFLKMHLNTAHNVVHLLFGAVAIWLGFSDDPKKSYALAMAGGIIFGVLGLAGFVLGEPGYPGVGHMEADENLLRIISNVLEFGTVDHLFHLGLSIVFLAGTYSWLKRREKVVRPIVQTQGRERVRK